MIDNLNGCGAYLRAAGSRKRWSFGPLEGMIKRKEMLIRNGINLLAWYEVSTMFDDNRN